MSGLIIGFGATKQQFVRDEERAIGDFIERRCVELGLGYFTEELAEEVRSFVKARGKEFQDKAAEHKTAETYLERYSSYWASVLDDANYIVVILHLHHINHRHALSPDGWAGLIEDATLTFSNSDMRAEAAA